MTNFDGSFRILVLFCVCAPILVHSGFTTTKIGPQPIWNSTHTDKLRQDLLLNYDKFARPAQHFNKTTVKLGMTIRHIEINEFKSTLTVHCWLRLDWTDEKLKWNESDYGNLNVLHLAEHEIWQPDIFLYNSATSTAINHYGNTHCLVYPNGEVLWVPPAQFTVLCGLNLRYWPFDTQECYMKFGSWTYSGDQIDLLSYNNATEVEENAALVDELEEVQTNIIIRKEERKFLLRKLCEYEPQIALEVQNAAKDGPGPRPNTSESGSKKSKKKSHSDSIDRRQSMMKSRKSSSKSRKRVVQPIPVDSNGRPVFPIELGRLTVHSLGEVISDRMEFHCEDAIYPVGYVSTRVYGSLKDPTHKCMYTCKISDINDLPRFEIASDDSCPPITGDTPDVCHSLLLQRINDALSLNVVSTRPRGNEFFGLSHPTVLHLIQSSPGTRKCIYYKWCKFEVSKSADSYSEDNDAGLSYEYLQRSINFCKYKMAPDVLQKPDEYVDSKEGIHLF